MSALTKVFVVLHVMLSVILTAGLVVFVNRTEPYRTVNATLTAQLQVAKQASVDQVAELAVARADWSQKLNDKQAENATLRTALSTAQTEAATLNGKIAELTSNVAQQTAQNTSLADALKVAQAANSTMQTNYAEARKGQDATQKLFNDASLHINDLQSQLDVTERQRRLLAEENTQITSDLQKAQTTINQAGLLQNPRVVNATPLVNLNGYISGKKVIGGVPYATISIGSADAVQKNMQFKVIDPEKNTFLGYLTIDSVEPHEATGRLDGPHITDVRRGVEVRTQLQ